MIVRVLILSAVLALAACGQRQPEDVRAQEGSYGASSGPNLNDPQADVANTDRTGTYDEHDAANGSEFGEHIPSSPGPNEPTQATKTP